MLVPILRDGYTPTGNVRTCLFHGKGKVGLRACESEQESSDPPARYFAGNNEFNRTFGPQPLSAEVRLVLVSVRVGESTNIIGSVCWWIYMDISFGLRVRCRYWGGAGSRGARGLGWIVSHGVRKPPL